MNTKRNILTYIVAILSVVALIIASYYYRYSGNLYRIQSYNFKYEQDKLLSFAEEDFSVLDSIRIAREIGHRDTLVNFIRDSILETKKTPENLYLSSLPTDEYVKVTKKDKLLIPLDSNAIVLLKTIASNSSTDKLPKELRQKANEYVNYYPSIFFKEDELPAEIINFNLQPNEIYYIYLSDCDGLGVEIEKLTKLYSKTEALEQYLKDNNVVSIPDSILFPYRQYIIYLIALLIIILFSPYYLYVYRTLKLANQEDNFQKKYAIIWIVITIVSVFGAVSVPLFDIDISKGGGALLIISLVLSVSGFLISILFLKRTRLLSQMLNEENIIVKWVYPYDLWQNYLEFEYKLRKQSNRKMFIFVASIIILIFGLFMVFDNKFFPVMFYVMLGFLLFLFFISRIVPTAQYKKQIKAKPVAIIASNGVLIGRILHSWNMFNSRLEKVEYKSEELHRLEITYSYSTKYGRENYTIKIPVPKSDENKVEFILDKLLSVKNSR